jgi:hypothetical protein
VPSVSDIGQKLVLSGVWGSCSIAKESQVFGILEFKCTPTFGMQVLVKNVKLVVLLAFPALMVGVCLVVCGVAAILLQAYLDPHL